MKIIIKSLFGLIFLFFIFMMTEDLISMWNSKFIGCEHDGFFSRTNYHYAFLNSLYIISNLFGVIVIIKNHRRWLQISLSILGFNILLTIISRMTIE